MCETSSDDLDLTLHHPETVHTLPLDAPSAQTTTPRSPPSTLNNKAVSHTIPPRRHCTLPPPRCTVPFPPKCPTTTTLPTLNFAKPKKDEAAIRIVEEAERDARRRAKERKKRQPSGCKKLVARSPTENGPEVYILT